jgi:hypothetical protein
LDAAWDELAWRALSAELDAWLGQGRRPSFWWRDDDAGRPDPALEHLLSLATSLGLPLGVAVVPAWLTAEVVGVLQAAPQAVVILQHGFAHANHERHIQAGERKVRPAECGGARLAPDVLAEVAEGAACLRIHLANRFLPVFVPPWNRIAPPVVAGLPQVGYRGLSAFGPRAAAEPSPDLLQVNCHADPILWREGKRFAGAAATLDRLRTHLAARREQHVDPTEPTGLLTHHRDIDPAGWAFLEEVLTRLRAHPAAAFPPLASLLIAKGRTLGEAAGRGGLPQPDS